MGGLALVGLVDSSSLLSGIVLGVSIEAEGKRWPVEGGRGGELKLATQLGEPMTSRVLNFDPSARGALPGFLYACILF